MGKKMGDIWEKFEKQIDFLASYEKKTPKDCRVRTARSAEKDANTYKRLLDTETDPEKRIKYHNLHTQYKQEAKELREESKKYSVRKRASSVKPDRPKYAVEK